MNSTSGSLRRSWVVRVFCLIKKNRFVRVVSSGIWLELRLDKFQRPRCTERGLLNARLFGTDTGWRKKKACFFFPNNCNFVYFQYKKIMLMPKQSVINAVLFTYIDYSITENYI